MFLVVQENRKTKATRIVGEFTDKAKATALAIRCSFAESNPNVIYTVL